MVPCWGLRFKTIGQIVQDDQSSQYLETEFRGPGLSEIPAFGVRHAGSRLLWTSHSRTRWGRSDSREVK